MRIRDELILASSSARRQDLLRQAGISFAMHSPEIPEVRSATEQPLDYALRLAQEKALAVAKRFPCRFVLGADTIVVAGDQLLEKPRDAEDAARMLRLLSGRGHEVTTAVSVITPTRKIDTRSCTTQVFFRELTEDEIQEYANSGEPLDKAGGYAIQGGAAKWIPRLEGDYSNVVGLPLPLVGEMLRANGFL